VYAIQRLVEVSGDGVGEHYDLDFKKYLKCIAGDWKNMFTEWDKAIYKDVAGDLLIKPGYARDNYW